MNNVLHYAFQSTKATVQLAGATQGFFTPRIPINGIVRVLQKIRTGFCGKAIALHVTAPRRLECAPI